MRPLDFGDAWVYATEEPDLFHYAAKRPDIARDANGRPQVSLIATSDGGFLQLTAKWGLDSARVDEIRDAVAKARGQDRSEVRLVPPSDTVEAVSLLLSDGEGDFSTLGTGRSSGTPPFNTVFSVMLDSARMHRARRGMAGERGLLLIRYEVTRTAPDTAREQWWAAMTETVERAIEGGTETSSSRHTAFGAGRAATPASVTFTTEADAADWSVA